MIGIGVLCVVAANWWYIPPVLKIFIIVGAYIGSVTAAFFCEKNQRPNASGVLLFLSGFILLGGLALLSQIFHIEGTIDGLLLTWIVVYAPTFLFVRNISIYILYEIVSAVYICAIFMNYNDSRLIFFGYDELRPTTLGPWRPFVIVLVVVAAAWWEWYREREALPAESQSKFRDFFVGGPTRRIMLSNFLIIIWFSWLYVINSGQESLLSYIMRVLAIGVTIQIIARLLGASDLDWQALVVISVCGLALTFDFAWEERFSRSPGNFTVEIVGSSAALGVYLVWRILSQNRGSGLATVFFCLQLIRRYFEMFFDFMDKGMFFLVGGVLLIAIGIAYMRLNKSRSVHDSRGLGHE
jgi:uncharacterized membrane protein